MNTITIAGRELPVITREQALAAGLGELTTPISIHCEPEILAEITGNLAAAGARIAWALTLCDYNGRTCAIVWRAGLKTCQDVEQEQTRSGQRIRPLDHYEPRTAALA